MKVCLSIAPNSMREALKVLQEFRNTNELIEVRTDGIKDLNLEILLNSTHLKLIITNRRRKEGGIFRGSDIEQFNILSHASELGAAYIDVELNLGINVVKKLVKQNRKTKVICSYHNFERTPENLLSIFESMRKTEASILKIATMANDILDNKKIFDLLRIANSSKQPLIALCMGEHGQISRIIGGNYGNYLSFAAYSSEEATALGQFSIEEMNNLFRAGSINKKTKIFGLIGNPVKYSRGIYYHNKQYM
jgi:3-dehydroquinate dehydratase/shikimate dehydrogenase